MSKLNTTEWVRDHREFFAWWKKHRHSGYVEVDGKAYWGETPWVAYTCRRYRAEFSVETGSPYEPTTVGGMLIRYTPEEIQKWKEEQKEHESRITSTHGYA